MSLTADFSMILSAPMNPVFLCLNNSNFTWLGRHWRIFLFQLIESVDTTWLFVCNFSLRCYVVSNRFLLEDLFNRRTHHFEIFFHWVQYTGSHACEQLN